MSFAWGLCVFLMGLLVGVVIVTSAAYYMLSHFFFDPEKDRPRVKPPETTSATFQLPPVLLTKVSDESCKSKESCWAFNFVLYFLFRELRNSEDIRRWMLKKLTLEFDELLATTVLGRFFNNITIQNIDVGQNFPIFNWIKTSKVELHPVFRNISTLDILVDLDYAGGFSFSIQAETHLRHCAYLAIRFNGLRGHARLQFTTDPYAHWSFSFVENPEIDISVTSQLYGKSFSQVTSVISSQLKRSVRKKHTLPMFKIRYKPFFSRIEHLIPALVPNQAPKVEVVGDLTVTVVECRGLMGSILQGNVYTALGAGDLDWIAAYTDDFNANFLIRDIVYIKTAKREVNLDFVLVMVNDAVVVESINPNVSTQNLRLINFEPGDEILAVDGKRVNSIKQCIKNFKNSSTMKVIWRIKRRCVLGLTPSQLDAWPEEPVATPEPRPSTSAAAQRSLDASSRNSKSTSELNTLTANSANTTPCPSRRSSMVREMASSLPSGNGESGGLLGDMSEARRTSCPVGRIVSEAVYPAIFRTTELPCCKDPIFLESFGVDVEESHKYLNLSVWSGKIGSSPGSPTGSPTASPTKKSHKGCDLDLITFNGNRVVGTISIPMTDIIEECKTTGMGYFVKDYYLSSPDGGALDAKQNPMVEHSGFEPHMCYGKVSLSFLFKLKDDGKRKDSADAGNSPPQIPHIEIGEEALPLAMSASNLSPTEDPQSHQFVRTHFRSATVCDYCNKKIWLKEAFACRVCNMKCHKKCNERCIANTICRGEGAYPATSTVSQPASPYQGAGGSGSSQQHPPAPEIITTDIDQPAAGSLSTEGSAESTVSGSPSLQPCSSSTSGQNGSSSRRKTLGGILSAVQSRSVQLRRAGSATTLLPPNLNPNSTSKSLPPSPQASPTTSRKASVSGGGGATATTSSAAAAAPGPSSAGAWPANPFEVLNASGLGASDPDLQAVIDHLVQHPNEDLESVAKESGRSIYCDMSLQERKQKLNNVLNRLQEEINVTTNERMALAKEEHTPGSSAAARQNVAVQVVKCEEKVHALSLLMLHYCSGLQHVQDLEESEKDEILISSTDDFAEDAGGVVGNTGAAAQ